jgi:hypothetical protein
VTNVKTKSISDTKLDLKNLRLKVSVLSVVNLCLKRIEQNALIAFSAVEKTMQRDVNKEKNLVFAKLVENLLHQVIKTVIIVCALVEKQRPRKDSITLTRK